MESISYLVHAAGYIHPPRNSFSPISITQKKSSFLELSRDGTSVWEEQFEHTQVDCSTNGQQGSILASLHVLHLARPFLDSLNESTSQVWYTSEHGEISRIS